MHTIKTKDKETDWVDGNWEYMTHDIEFPDISQFSFVSIYFNSLSSERERGRG